MKIRGVREGTHHSGGIGKHSFIYLYDQAYSSCYTNATRKRSFAKRLRSNRRNLNTPALHFRMDEKRIESGGAGDFRKRSSPAFHFRVDGKHIENRAFRKRLCSDNHVISLTVFFDNTNSKWALTVAFLDSSGVVHAWMEYIWCVFTVEPCTLYMQARICLHVLFLMNKTKDQIS